MTLLSRPPRKKSLVAGVLLGVFLESPFTGFSAEVQGLAFIDTCGSSLPLIYLHAAYRILCHYLPPLFYWMIQTHRSVIYLPFFLELLFLSSSSMTF